MTAEGRDEMRWVLPGEEGGQAEDLRRELGVHPVAARVLAARGFRSADEARRFLSDRLADLPDPFSMRGMERAVERLVQALKGREKISLYGDYDVDGVSSTTMLALFLRGLGAEVATYIPHRLAEGYGLNLEAVGKIAAAGTRLLVTLDCGITSVAEVQKAVDLGMEVLVVDHHQAPPDLPPAAAILNPHQPGCAFPSKELCAAGVTFHLLMALRRRLREAGHFAAGAEPNLREYLDLAALATIADVVPLTGANRILVKHGLAELGKGQRPGIRCLKEVAGIGGSAEVSVGQVAFRLAPRVNAAGRLDDASVGVELLSSRDPARAAALAGLLDRANQERQGIEKKILAEAVEDARALGGSQARGLVLAREGWHAGVIGIVASRVVEAFHRPTVMIALNGEAGRGSARSIEGFHLYDALKACETHLSRFGGHKHAAGLSIDSGRVHAFREEFDKVARQRISEEDLVARCRIDAVLRPSEVDDGLVEALSALGPFGAGNPEPVIASFGLPVKARVLAPKGGDGPGHLKLQLAGGLSAIGFGMGGRLPAGPAFDLAYTVGFNEWQGQARVELRLKDLRAAAPAS